MASSLLDFFPVYIAKAVSIALAANNGGGQCSDDILLASFCNYISVVEKVTIESALAGPPLQSGVTSVLPSSSRSRASPQWHVLQ